MGWNTRHNLCVFLSKMRSLTPELHVVAYPEKNSCSQNYYCEIPVMYASACGVKQLHIHTWLSCSIL